MFALWLKLAIASCNKLVAWSAQAQAMMLRAGGLPVFGLCLVVFLPLVGAVRKNDRNQEQLDEGYSAEACKGRQENLGLPK